MLHNDIQGLKSFDSFKHSILEELGDKKLDKSYSCFL